ncbi:MAG: SusC/RagA family TonB-linked outer membrane protein [Spirosomataceae bacterium]
MHKKTLLHFVWVMLLSLQVVAQERIVTGKVTGDDGAGIPGVNIVISGTYKGANTAADGTYRLSVPTGNVVLIFSSVGYVKQEVTVGPRSVVDVQLKGDAKVLSEVVVIGYGTQTRRDATGSIGTVKGATIAQMPIQSFESGLAGRTAGVQITVPNGVLNTPPVFRIRGTNSISLSSYPLVVVDGVPVPTGDFSSTNAAGNALASINPNDIESMDVAKDAAATAIYGSRAANGVVFITTKRGTPGKVKINYDGWVGFTNTYRIPEMMGASDYLTFKTKAVANNPSASAVKFTQTNDANGKPIDTKWADQVYRQGFSHSHNLNVSGGNENTNYYFSTGYTAQQGVIRKNDFNRVNALFNIDSKLSKIFTVGGKLSFSNERNLAAASSGSLSGEAFNTAGLGRLAIVLPSIISPYNNDGTYNLNGSAIGSAANISGIASLSYYNPTAILNLNRSNSETNHMQGNAYAQLKPFSWLTLKSTYGIDYLLVDNDLFWSPVTGDGFSYGGYATNSYGKYKTTLWTNTAQADYSFNDTHNFSLLIGQEQQRRTSRGFGLNRQTLSDPAYTEIQAGWVSNNASGLVYGENYLISGFGRLNYNYKNKYFLSANGRQDEYSGLGEKKGIFWGASAGWEISQEPFWTSAHLDHVFSSFKIRGSYGKVGNIGGIGDYTPYSTYGSGLYGGASTLAFSSVGNPNLRWETSKKTDIGFQFGILNERISGEVAYYKNDIDNLILYVSQAPSTGLPSNPPQNVGTMYNKGLEVSLNARVINTKSFQWTSNFNITFNKNEVTSLAPGLNVIQTGTSGSETVNQTAPGYALGYLWVIRTAGVDPSTGKRIFVNSEGKNVYYQFYAPAGTYNYSFTPDGKTPYTNATKGGSAITQANDAVMYANVIPKQYGGWDNNFRFMNFDLGVMLTYQLGYYVYYGTNAGLHDQRWWNNATDVLTDAWQQEGDTGKKYAKPVFNDNVSNGSAMPLDINVFKGDFLKLRSLTLGYTVPQSIINKAKISSLRVYVSGQNLAVLTKYPGPDPEVSSNGNSIGQGVDRNTAGNARTITIGVKLGL